MAEASSSTRGPLTYATLILLVVGVTLVASLGSAVLRNVLVNMLITLILVVGLYVFVGNSGIVSFGHIGFMAIGAYTAGIVRIPRPTKAALLQLPDVLERAHFSALQATLLGGGLAAAVAASNSTMTTMSGR